MAEYDAYDLKPQRKRRGRVSAITGKPTSLWPETEVQIAMVVRYNKQCDHDKNLRDKTLLWAVAPNNGKRPQHQSILAQRMGERADIYDLHMLDWRSGETKYFWFEVKDPDRRSHKNGGLSAGQKEIGDKLSATSVQRFVLYTVDEFAKFL